MPEHPLYLIHKMGIPDSNRDFWDYLSQTQKDLILEGQYLMNDVIKHSTYHFKDYSFLVFPFSKAYEGFLKQLFRDIKFITHLDYISDHLRLGKLLSPQLADRLGERSLYVKIRDKSSEQLANNIWQTWKVARNEVFHYYPHNNKALQYESVQLIVNTILQVMQESYAVFQPKKIQPTS